MTDDHQISLPRLLQANLEQRLGKKISRVKAIYGDVSSRGFFRLFTGDRSLILMLYPKTDSKIMDRDYTLMSSFALAGLSPYPVARGGSWFLVEDAGERDLSDHFRLGNPVDREDRIRKVLALLPKIQSLPAEIMTVNPPLDEEWLTRELGHTREWYLSAHLRKEHEEKAGQFLNDLAKRVGAYPRSFCHRDFHANNILLREDGRTFLVDVQDARLGPRFYDPVSLLYERALTELSKNTREFLLRHTVNTLYRLTWSPQLREEILYTALQRCLKALGTFARQVESGRETYREFLESGQRILDELLDDLNLSDLKNTLM